MDTLRSLNPFGSKEEEQYAPADGQQMAGRRRRRARRSSKKSKRVAKKSRKSKKGSKKGSRKSKRAKKTKNTGSAETDVNAFSFFTGKNQ